MATKIKLSSSIVLFFVMASQFLYAAAVPIGSSSLINILDYSDTFTIDPNGPGPRNNTTKLIDYTEAQRNIENAYGNPVVSWAPPAAVPYYFHDTNRAKTTD